MTFLETILLSILAAIISATITSFIMEEFHTLESNSGFTKTFMFEISSLFRHNPNDAIKEMYDRKEDFNSLINHCLVKKK